MAYTTINKSSLHFNTNLYTGNNSNTAHTGIGFQPDFVWLKVRNANGAHYLYDAIRGANKDINSNDDTAENTTTQNLMSFDSDGYTVGTSNSVNTNGETMVGWNWKAGTGQGSSNTDGSINTTYTSVNTTAGFSISQYTGTGNSGATVGHGLGAAPGLILIKNISANSTNWGVYHKSLGGTKAIFLDLNNAADTNSKYFNDTDPTSSVFTLGNYNDENSSGENHIAYCFAEKTGYSKFGSYTGNGNADGAFVYTGFKPAFVMIKKTDGTGYWVIQDNKRTSTSGTNPNDKWIYPNESDAEYDASSYPMDLLSNGFKIRHNGNYQNTANNYIYMAFGQSLVGSNNVPCTAR